MSRNYSAGQYEKGFKPAALGNWAQAKPVGESAFSGLRGPCLRPLGCQYYNQKQSETRVAAPPCRWTSQAALPPLTPRRARIPS